MQADRQLNKRQTVQNVKERLKWILRLERMSGAPKRITVDYKAHKLTLNAENVAELPERAKQWQEALETIIADLNRINISMARKILIEKYYTRIYKENEYLGAPKISDYNVFADWHISETTYYHYQQDGMLEFARIHNEGELLAYDGA